MPITITDPALLTQLSEAIGPVELAAPDGRVLGVMTPPMAAGVMTPQKADEIIAAARQLGADPLFDDWVRAVEEYRRENNTVPDAD